jgi:hypothetical protein
MLNQCAPLDRATDAGVCSRGPLSGLGDHAHRFHQFASGIRGCRQATAGIETAAVLQFELVVETEEVRRANGRVAARDVLRRVVEVGERKIELAATRCMFSRNPRGIRPDRCS